MLEHSGAYIATRRTHEQPVVPAKHHQPLYLAMADEFSVRRFSVWRSLHQLDADVQLGLDRYNNAPQHTALLRRGKSILTSAR